MKCLYCGGKFNEEEDLRKHHEREHKVNSKNFFHQALFEKDKLPNYYLRKCFRCQNFLVSEKEERKHNFLHHLQKGSSTAPPPPPSPQSTIVQ